MMAGPIVEIAPPVRADRVGGLTTVATFRTNTRLGAAGGLTFQSGGCTFPQISEHLCYVGEVEPDDKNFDGIDLIDAIGDPFPLYAGVQCFAGPDPDQSERARRALEEGRDRPLEAALVEWAQGGVELAGGGGGVTGAIARAEQALDSDYVGRGALLMSRQDVVTASAEGSVERIDGTIVTVNGTPVLASGWVVPGTVYAVGAIAVEHSPLEVHEVINPELNTLWALAEAIYAIAVDCAFRRVSYISGGDDVAPVGIANTIDNGDGTFSFLLTDDTVTDPIALLPGVRGSQWFTGEGHPSTQDPEIDALPLDLYLDTESGELFQWQESGEPGIFQWTQIATIPIEP